MSAVDLPPELLERFIELASAGLAARRGGDAETAEAHYLAAWDVIPEPKRDCDRSGSFTTAIMDFYLETGQPKKAWAWLPLYEQFYDLDVDHDMWVGKLAYASGDLERAAAAFGRAHAAYGRRPFQGENPQYWEFLVQSRLR